MLRCYTLCCGVADSASPRQKSCLLTSQGYPEVSATVIWFATGYFGQRGCLGLRFLGQFLIFHWGCGENGTTSERTFDLSCLPCINNPSDTSPFLLTWNAFVFQAFFGSSTAWYGWQIKLVSGHWGVGGHVRVLSLHPLSHLPFVLVCLECVTATTAELTAWYKRVSAVNSKSGFLRSCLFSWTSYAASEVLICAESAWKHSESGTRPFHPPYLGIKIRLRNHRDYNCLSGISLLEWTSTCQGGGKGGRQSRCQRLKSGDLLLCSGTAELT